MSSNGIFPIFFMLMAVASQQRRKAEAKKEEAITMNYSAVDLNGETEFKILRSNLPIFKKEARLKAICSEESQVGWTFLEKLDDRRIRLKRLKKSSTMTTSNFDPYRSNYPFAFSDFVDSGLPLIYLFFMGLAVGIWVLTTVSH